jgi:hypothetical protein
VTNDFHSSWGALSDAFASDPGANVVRVGGEIKRTACSFLFLQVVLASAKGSVFDGGLEDDVAGIIE